VISVIVYALNDADTIVWCLDSLVTQRHASRFDVVVIDDGSADETAQIVAARYPQFGLLRQQRTQGWVAALGRALPVARGPVLAFLGSHCSADKRWVATMEREMSQGWEVITGSGQHGEGRFLARFEALSVHPDYVSTREGEVPSVWDDNFAIRRAVLERALPEVDGALSDGAGAVLLSLALKRQGVRIHYRPAVQIDHTTHSLGEIIRFWHGEMAENAVAIKLADPSLPWARRLWLGPIAAAVLAGGSLWHGVRAVLRARSALRISLGEAVVHCCLLACLMPVYFAGLCREIARNWDRIGAAH
jgi:glycosyltransferase involved in cell wall biosynthesis